mgnify:CR=1 FL=1
MARKKLKAVVEAPKEEKIEVLVEAPVEVPKKEESKVEAPSSQGRYYVSCEDGKCFLFSPDGKKLSSENDGNEDQLKQMAYNWNVNRGYPPEQ